MALQRGDGHRTSSDRPLRDTRWDEAVASGIQDDNTWCWRRILVYFNRLHQRNTASSQVWTQIRILQET